MNLRRLGDLPLLLLAGVLVLPVLTVFGSSLAWDSASGQILREMGATVLPDYALSSLILCIGYIMAGFTEKKQGLHDMVAGTLVVKR